MAFGIQSKEEADFGQRAAGWLGEKLYGAAADPGDPWGTPSGGGASIIRNPKTGNRTMATYIPGFDDPYGTGGGAVAGGGFDDFGGGQAPARRSAGPAPEFGLSDFVTDEDEFNATEAARRVEGEHYQRDVARQNAEAAITAARVNRRDTLRQARESLPDSTTLRRMRMSERFMPTEAELAMETMDRARGGQDERERWMRSSFRRKAAQVEAARGVREILAKADALEGFSAESKQQERELQRRAQQIGEAPALPDPSEVYRLSLESSARNRLAQAQAEEKTRRNEAYTLRQRRKAAQEEKRKGSPDAVVGKLTDDEESILQELDSTTPKPDLLGTTPEQTPEQKQRQTILQQKLGAVRTRKLIAETMKGGGMKAARALKDLDDETAAAAAQAVQSMKLSREDLADLLAKAKDAVKAGYAASRAEAIKRMMEIESGPIR